ncbi:MAG: hypothetical protein GY927_19900 [bacterium]|nr:hypothetical protein [bacterium]
MTQKHALPSKFKEFVPIAAGAPSFSILFLFGLSAFVNNLFHTTANTTHTPMVVATSPAMPGKSDTYKNTSDNVAGNTTSTPPANPQAATVSIGEILAAGNAKKGAKVVKNISPATALTKATRIKSVPISIQSLATKSAQQRATNILHL